MEWINLHILKITIQIFFIQFAEFPSTCLDLFDLILKIKLVANTRSFSGVFVLKHYVMKIKNCIEIHLFSKRKMSMEHYLDLILCPIISIFHQVISSEECLSKFLFANAYLKYLPIYLTTYTHLQRLSKIIKYKKI